jgi:CheY-like chemotaxis protein
MAYILLVEDDTMISRMLTMRLMLRGHKVETVFNGQEAVDAALGGEYDLVLMDMHMPVLDGYTATRILRQRGYKKLVVAVTASALIADSTKAIEVGCSDHISKPIGPDFEERVDEILSGIKTVSCKRMA